MAVDIGGSIKPSLLYMGDLRLFGHSIDTFVSLHHTIIQIDFGEHEEIVK
jgi:hypothetical protein